MKLNKKQSDNVKAMRGQTKQLKAIKVQVGQARKKSNEWEKYIKALESQLSSVGDDAQLANVDMQNMLQKQQQTMQMMSNISKMLHDTAMAVIRKIG